MDIKAPADEFISTSTFLYELLLCVKVSFCVCLWTMWWHLSMSVCVILYVTMCAFACVKETVPSSWNAQWKLTATPLSHRRPLRSCLAPEHTRSGAGPVALAWTSAGSLPVSLQNQLLSGCRGMLEFWKVWLSPPHVSPYGVKIWTRSTDCLMNPRRVISGCKYTMRFTPVIPLPSS